MAHHQERRRGRAHTTPALSSLIGTSISSDMPLAVEDEIDADEPPDNHIQFSRRPTPYTLDPNIDADYFISKPLPTGPKQSLLTRALLTSPDLMATPTAELPPPLRLSRGTSTASTHSNTSADSIAELTSDGGLTSPPRTATPSPPLPPVDLTPFALLTPKATTQGGIPSPPQPFITDAQETTVEAGLGRKRCIKFACGRQAIPQDQGDHNAHIKTAEPETLKLAEQPKRHSVLRFACSNRPSEEATCQAQKDKSLQRHGSSPVSSTTHVPSEDTPKHRQHRDSESTVKQSPQKAPTKGLSLDGPRKSPVYDQQDSKRSSATKFYEFASSIDQNDEWMLEQTAHRSRLTVNDTLRKENAIRQLGEEAEAEALEEDEAEEQAEFEQDGNDVDDFDDGSDDDASDGGNETDDEEGFADSDDESDGCSEYQFWTTGLTTAATSTDHLDQIRTMPQRTTSESSIESMIHAGHKGEIASSGRRMSRSRKHAKMRPATPDLPDSTDFVCGTLDEDHPLEAAYMSCLEQRRRSKHKTIPQDIDPSFPTSDFEDEDDEEDDDDHAPAEASDEHLWIAGQPDNSDDERPRSRTKATSRPNNKSPPPRRLRSPPLPKRSVAPPPRLRSPPPPKRCANNRSPPPRRLFGQSPRRRQSPPPHLRNLKSPPSTRGSSLAVSPGQKTPGVNVPYLAQRPDLTHTKSLPRSPNPFWLRHREAHQNPFDAPPAGALPAAELHTRGPIDIVRGLENKRQRRKEKFWRQHCRNAGKDKERRCQPGKGAERMRELGLEMAGRGKGCGPKAQLVLSI